MSKFDFFLVIIVEKHFSIRTDDMWCNKVQKENYLYSATDGDGYAGLTGSLTSVDVTYTGYLKYSGSGEYLGNYPNSTIVVSGEITNTYMMISNVYYYAS